MQVLPFGPYAGIVQRIVYQPSKLRMRVRFPLPAPRGYYLVYISVLLCIILLPPFPNNTLYATVVQSVERLICNQYVTGSSPVGSSRVQMSGMMIG